MLLCPQHFSITAKIKEKKTQAGALERGVLLPCSTPLGSSIRAESGSSRYFSCGLWVGRRWGAAAEAQGVAEAGREQPGACGGLWKRRGSAEGGVQFLGPAILPSQSGADSRGHLRKTLPLPPVSVKCSERHGQVPAALK